MKKSYQPKIGFSIRQCDKYFAIRCTLPISYRIAFIKAIPRWVFDISHGPLFTDLLTSRVTVLNIPISQFHDRVPYGKTPLFFLAEMISVALYQAVLDFNGVY